MIGTKLGPYEILEKIGAGGMGEVYRARDSRLGREVAIKVLPPGLASNPDRLRRFEQEARAAGQLNHPNILAIHDVGTHAGAPYVVSELLEGETLRQRIEGGALPPRKAVELAIQIAHGLSAAHDKGIVHRDLKPENLFVTRDGRLKILDFGLAKLTQSGASGEALTNLPTTPIQTDPGKIMGTAGYMSPEQVRGGDADPRSDIFSLGAILYEMAAGARAFRRPSAVETMNAILKEDPPDLSATDARVPPGLERIVRHCLEKNPEERFQSARDLAFDLQSLSGTGEAVTAATGKADRLAGRRIGWILAAIAVVLGVGAAGYLAGARAHPASSNPEFKPLTFRRGAIYSARFTPDGQTIVYGAAWEGKPFEIFMTRPESPESRPLGIADAEPLAVSRSGELAIRLRPRVFLGWMSQGTLARMGLSGGAPREIAEGVGDADWSPDGADLVVSRFAGGRSRLEYPPGKPLYESSGWVSHPRFSRDGKRIAFIDHPAWGDDRGIISVLNLNDGSRKALTKPWSSAWGVAWSPDDGEIFFSGKDLGSRTLRAVSLDGSLRVVTRVPGHVTLHDILPDGRMLLTSDIMRRGILALPPGESRERDLSWLDWSFPDAISRDGRWVLFEEQAAGAGNAYYAIYLRPTDGSPAIYIGEGLSSAISPDGKWVLAVQDKPSRHLALLPTGPGQARILPGTEIAERFGDTWSEDNRIFFSGREPGKEPRVYVLDPSGGPRRPVTPEGKSVAFLAVSADGKRLALGLTDGGLQVFPVEGGEPRSYPAPDQSIYPQIPLAFSEDGRSLYLQQPEGVPGRIHRLDLATGRREVWREIASPDSTGILGYGPGLVTPDGRAYVMSYRQMISTLFLVFGSGGGGD